MENQTEFSLKESVNALVSAAKRHEWLVFREAPTAEIQAKYIDMKNAMQKLTPEQQSQVMGSVRDSVIRANGQQPAPGLNGYGTLRTVYSDVLIDRLDDLHTKYIYATRNGLQESREELSEQVASTIEGLPEDQLSDLNSNAKTFHNAKDLSGLEKTPQNVRLEAFKQTESLILNEIALRVTQQTTTDEQDSLIEAFGQ